MGTKLSGLISPKQREKKIANDGGNTVRIKTRSMRTNINLRVYPERVEEQNLDYVCLRRRGRQLLF